MARLGDPARKFFAYELRDEGSPVSKLNCSYYKHSSNRRARKGTKYRWGKYLKLKAAMIV